jgi:hypothetical protein
MSQGWSGITRCGRSPGFASTSWETLYGLTDNCAEVALVARTCWWALYGLALPALLVFRVLVPLRRGWRHRLRGLDVVQVILFM